MPNSPEQIVEHENFRDFLVRAKQNAYPNPSAEARVVATTGGGREISFTEAPFTYVDQYVGGDPFGGHEFVALRAQKVTGDVDVPIWNMSYYETEFEEGINLTAAHLREILGRVLQNPDEELPVRGPLGLNLDLPGSGRVKYTFEPERGSKLGKFSAEETIKLNGRRVYVARFIGGIINYDKRFVDAS